MYIIHKLYLWSPGLDSIEFFIDFSCCVMITCSRHRLFKRWIALSIGWITIQWITIREYNCVIHWIQFIHWVALFTFRTSNHRIIPIVGTRTLKKVALCHVSLSWIIVVVFLFISKCLWKSVETAARMWNSVGWLRLQLLSTGQGKKRFGSSSV